MVLKGIISAISCSFASFLIHLAISFFRKGRLMGEPLIFELKRQAKLLLLIWSFLLPIYAVLFFSLPGKINIMITGFNAIPEATGFIYGIIFYLILSFIYLTIYYLVDRSVSATILEIIECSQNKKLTLDGIKEIYNIEQKYQNELKGMLEGRFIIKELDYYRNSLKGRLYVRMAKLMKSLLKLGQGG